MSIYGNEKPVLLNDLYSEKQLKTFNSLLLESLFIVLNIKLWTYRNPWNVPTRKISDNLMLIVKSGRIQASVDGYKKILDPGDILVVPEFVEHAYHLARGNSSAECYILHVLCDLPGRDTPFSKLRSRFFSLRFADSGLAELQRITAFRNISKEKATSAAAGFVRNFFFEQIEQNQLELDLKTPVDHRMESAIKFMQNNLSGMISVCDIATAAGLHEVRFRELFNKTFHCPPLQELNRMRLIRSLGMLSRGQDDVTTIARECGFNSVSYYCLAFRKYFKISPVSFRNKYLR